MSCRNIDFLRALVLKTAFVPEPLRKAQAALLLMALENTDFTAADLPGEITNGDPKLAGMATGALLNMGLVISIGDMPSPNENAHGRRVNILRIAPGKRATIKTWLARHKVEAPEPQGQLAL